MSMYSQLLVAALDIDTPAEVEPTASAALARLLRSRRRLAETQAPHGGAVGAYAVVVDTLAHDVALIALVRLLGVECDVSEFDRPEVARAGLERELSARGISLDELDGRLDEDDRGHAATGSSGALDHGRSMGPTPLVGERHTRDHGLHD